MPQESKLPAAAVPAAGPLLQLQGVSKRYGPAVVLADIAFSAERGEAIALWGANGAGKTTLLKAILGLIDVSGDIHVRGVDVRRDGKAARRAIGYVPQDVTFYEGSVAASLSFFAQLKGGAIPLARQQALLERLGLQPHAGKLVSRLSGGLRQRLALAVALLADPPVLLLDEPTANLDAQAQRDYLALLHQLVEQEGKTLLFASHRLEEVELLATRVLMLEHGRLVDSLTPEALLTRLMPYVKLTLWVPEAQRAETLDRFIDAGLRAHLNGRGTVVVQVRTEQRMELFRLLRDHRIPVLDLSMERSKPWS